MPRTLKIILKVIAALVVVIILLFFGSLWYITHNKNKVLKLVNDELNAKFDGAIIIGDLKPNFFQHFPNISLGLKDVLIRDKRFAEHHRTLLNAKDFSISVKAWPLLTGSLDINHIDISNATVDLFTDSTGYSNRSVFRSGHPKKKDTSSTNNYDSQLGRFSLTNVNFIVEDLHKRKRFDFIANQLNGTMSNPDTGWNAAFHMDVTAKSMAFNTKNGSFIKNKVLEGDLTAGYNNETGRLWVKSPSLDIADDPFVVSAVFQTLNQPSSFNIHLEAKKAMWRRVSALLSANIQRKLDQFNITEPIAVRGIISGSFAGGGDPSLYVTATVKDNTVITPGGTIKHCSFGGVFSNEYKKGGGFNDDNSVIRLVDFQGTYSHMPFWMAEGDIINLNKPIAVGDFNADFPLSYANGIMAKSVARFTRGRAIMHLKYKGDIVNYQLNKPVVAGSIILRNADFKYLPENISFENSAISLLIKKNDLLLRNIRLQSGKSVVSMEGRVNNFMNLYYSAPEKILVHCDISSPQLYLGEFLGVISGNAQDESTTGQPAGGDNSGNVITQLNTVLQKSRVDMNLQVNSVYYKKFVATDVHAEVLTSEDKVVVRDVGLKHAGGSLKLNGSVAKGRKSNQLDLNTVISHVNIREFFGAFDNFGLTDFTAENLKGYLSAKTQITASMSDQGKLMPKSINGTLDLNLQDGALVNFNPIGSIAKFAFPRRDLKNIQIRELNGRFDVHGDKITVYPLKFSSSVLNMDVAGVYGLNGGTNLALDVPLRNPKNDTTITNQAKLEKKRYKGIVLHIRATSDSTGKIKIGWNKDRKKEEGK